MQLTLYLIYDGNFQGLLTALYHALCEKEKTPYIIKSGTKVSGELFAQYKEIHTSNETAKKLSGEISGKISKSVVTRLYYAYLSEIDGIENIILEYLRLGFKNGKKIEELLFHEVVDSLNRVVKKVSRERHRMLGFLRFKKLNFGVYYAAMEPDYNILTLIGPHFKKRLPDQSFIIHDVKRGMCALYNKEELLFTGEKLPLEKLKEDSQEIEFRSLWKNFFEHITIEERKNLKIQQQLLPKKYWKYLSEKE